LRGLFKYIETHFTEGETANTIQHMSIERSDELFDAAFQKFNLELHRSERRRTGEDVYTTYLNNITQIKKRKRDETANLS
jgi:hypothetical protein